MTPESRRYTAARLCVNGDGNPICPPSKVICRACMDRIRQTLRDMVKDAEVREEVRHGR